MQQNKKIFSKRKSSWSKEAQFKIDNEKWLSYSAEIALRIHAIIESDEDMKQKELANSLKISPQQISKILKGKQNLTLKTIGNLSDALGFELISFPDYADSHIMLTKATPSFALPIISTGSVPATGVYIGDALQTSLGIFDSLNIPMTGSSAYYLDMLNKSKESENKLELQNKKTDANSLYRKSALNAA